MKRRVCIAIASRIASLFPIAALAACTQAPGTVPGTSPMGAGAFSGAPLRLPHVTQHLYVANGDGGGTAGSVSVYALGASKPAYVVTNGIFNAHAMAFDSAGNLYVANYGRQTVTEYARGTNKLVATLTAPNLYYPNALALDANDNLYVGAGSYTVVFAAKTHKLLRTMAKGTSQAYGLALDKAANVYVLNFGPDDVVVYNAGKTTIARTISQDFSYAIRMALDAHGDLWVANLNAGLLEFLPGSTTVAKQIGNGTEQPLSVSFDAAGNLYDGCSCPPGEVWEFAPPGFSLSRTILLGSGYGHQPVSTVTDAAGNLYVADYPNWNSNGAGGSIAVVTPGKTAPSQTITSGVLAPWAVAIGP